MLPLLNSTQNLSGLADGHNLTDTVETSQVAGDKSFSDVYSEAKEATESGDTSVVENITPEQLAAMKQHMADGKSLPEAAKLALGELSQTLTQADFKQIAAELEKLPEVAAEVVVEQEQAETATEEAGQKPEAATAQKPVQEEQAQANNALPVAEANKQAEQAVADEAGKAATADSNKKAAAPEAVATVVKNETTAKNQQAEAANNTKAAEAKAQTVATSAGGGAQTGSENLLGNSSYASASLGMANGATAATVTPVSGNSFTQIMAQTIPQPVTQNLHGAEWGGAVGERVLWMVGKNVQSAQLNIKPAHLGPIEISVKMDKDQATVSFTSSHPVVRDALEQSVPKLREMFSQQNIDLADVNVRDQQTADNFRQQASGDADGQLAGDNSDAGGDDEVVDALPPETRSIVSDGLVDAYA